MALLRQAEQLLGQDSGSARTRKTSVNSVPSRPTLGGRIQLLPVPRLLELLDGSLPDCVETPLNWL